MKPTTTSWRLSQAARSDSLREDISRGYALAVDPATRLAQQRFIGLAELHLKELREVLRNAADPDQRAIAAYVVGYASDTKSVVSDLQYAMRDPNSAVRSNAARALNAIATMAREQRAQKWLSPLPGTSRC